MKSYRDKLLRYKELTGDANLAKLHDGSSFTIPPVSELMMSGLLLSVLLVLWLPMPIFLLDFGLAINFCAVITLLMFALYVKRPSEFSTLSFLLLINAFGRIALMMDYLRHWFIEIHHDIFSKMIGFPESQIIHGFTLFTSGGFAPYGLFFFLAMVIVNIGIVMFGVPLFARTVMKRIPADTVSEDIAALNGFQGSLFVLIAEMVMSLLITLAAAGYYCYLLYLTHPLPKEKFWIEGPLSKQFIWPLLHVLTGNLFIYQIPILVSAVVIGLLICRQGQNDEPIVTQAYKQVQLHPYALLFAGLFCSLVAATDFVTGLPWYWFLAIALVLFVLAFDVWIKVDKANLDAKIAEAEANTSISEESAKAEE